MRELQKVDSPVEARVRVKIGTELHAHPLEKFHERAGRIMGAAVERHMLEKMSKTALVLRLVERARQDEKA